MSLNRYVRAAAAGLLVLVSVSARSADSAGASDLEQITVYAPHAGGSSLGGTTIGQADIQQFNRDTLDSAVLLAPGVTVSSVGARNETDVYADRSRFPIPFEMYSTRFGTFINNPELRPERSHYTQVGVDDSPLGTHVVVNAFFARIVDGIVSVPLSPALSESQNVGVERRYGYEVELARQLATTLKAGLNFSDLVRESVAGNAVTTDTPDHKFFAFLEWRPVQALAIVPSLDIEGKRWLQSAVNNTVYYRGGSYSMLNMKAAYQLLPDAMVELGTTNLSDRNYPIEDGYHAPGRQYFANLRLTF